MSGQTQFVEREREADGKIDRPDLVGVKTRGLTRTVTASRHC